MEYYIKELATQKHGLKVSSLTLWPDMMDPPWVRLTNGNGNGNGHNSNGYGKGNGHNKDDLSRERVSLLVYEMGDPKSEKIAVAMGGISINAIEMDKPLAQTLVNNGWRFIYFSRVGIQDATVLNFPYKNGKKLQKNGDEFNPENEEHIRNPANYTFGESQKYIIQNHSLVLEHSLKAYDLYDKDKTFVTYSLSIPIVTDFLSRNPENTYGFVALDLGSLIAGKQLDDIYNRIQQPGTDTVEQARRVLYDIAQDFGPYDKEILKRTEERSFFINKETGEVIYAHDPNLGDGTRLQLQAEDKFRDVNLPFVTNFNLMNQRRKRSNGGELPIQTLFVKSANSPLSPHENLMEMAGVSGPTKIDFNEHTVMKGDNAYLYTVPNRNHLPAPITNEEEVFRVSTAMELFYMKHLKQTEKNIDSKALGQEVNLFETLLTNPEKVPNVRKEQMAKIDNAFRQVLESKKALDAPSIRKL